MEKTGPRRLQAIVEGFLYRKQITLIAGGPFAGKSTGVLKGLVFPLCLGEPTMLETQGPPIKVLFCSERDEDFVFEQLVMMKLDSSIPDTLRFFYLEDMTDTQFNDFTCNPLAYISKVHMADFKADLVVFDTMVNFQTVRDTNSYTENMKELRRLKRWSTHHNCSSLPLYHSPKQNERNKYDDPFHKVLGSTAILAAATASAVMERLNDNVVEMHFRSHLSRLKTPRYFEYVTFKETDGAFVGTEEFFSLSQQQALYLSCVPNVPVPFVPFNKEMAVKLDVSINQARNIANDLAHKKHLIRFEEDALTGDKTVLKITPS